SLVLIDERNIFSGDVGCNACHAFGDTSLSVDLDQLTVQSVRQEDFQASLVEVSDSPSEIEYWDQQKPEDRGPPPRRPKFPITNFRPIGHIIEKVGLPSDEKTEQRRFVWAFSDNITVAFFDVWNGNVKLQKQLLQSKSETPHLVSKNVPTTIAKTHGKSVKRMVEVAGTRVSPKNAFEKLADILLKFDIPVLSPNAGETFVSDRSDDGTSGLMILRNAMMAASQGRSRLILRGQASKKVHSTTYFAKSYGNLSACLRDEGPEGARAMISRWPPTGRPWLREGSEKPPIISADRLDTMWKFEITSGTLFVVQQWDDCGTAPELYGDLISVYVPKNAAEPLQYRRL